MGHHKCLVYSLLTDPEEKESGGAIEDALLSQESIDAISDELETGAASVDSAAPNANVPCDDAADCAPIFESAINNETRQNPEETRKALEDVDNMRKAMLHAQVDMMN